MSQNVSTGRGGAGKTNLRPLRTSNTSAYIEIGNIGKEPPAMDQDLATPTIKADTYTTGRGGSGNMAKNDPKHPEIARASQDVEPVPKTGRSGSFHVGRGGAANIAKTENDSKGSGIVEIGKDLLDKVGGKK